ncbi:hypothetical protein GCM10012278_13180 [Nonomuraea glycinis]|uniref:Uncharacterized protein n=2 Tax=Nonomuraea glycinis TaxID=2047744 RepID=A0A918A1A8_9ACTN|nr:hypothetical protein GCM10012278_13180 [Nonomuraea glycinis]
MLAMAGTLSLALVAVLSPPVSADDDHDKHHHRHDDDLAGRCNPHAFFKVNRISPRNFFVPRTRFIDGPGGSMTVSVTREHEVLAFIETEKERQRERGKQRTNTHTDTRSDTNTDAAGDTHTETREDAHTDTRTLIRRFRRMGLPHLEERHMVFTGHEYTQEISKGMYGNMWYRVLGYRIGWSSWRVLGTCRHVEIDRGIANVPARVEGWRYWETKHPKFKGRLISEK